MEEMARSVGRATVWADDVGCCARAGIWLWGFRAPLSCWTGHWAGRCCSWDLCMGHDGGGDASDGEAWGETGGRDGGRAGDGWEADWPMVNINAVGDEETFTQVSDARDQR